MSQMSSFLLCHHRNSSQLNEKIPEAKKTEKMQSLTESSSNVSETIEPEPNASSIANYQSQEFNDYRQEIQSSDFVATTILNILQKLIANERDATLVKSSTTIKSLWFAVNQYHCIEQNRPFHDTNHVLIKRKLLIIIFMCLNKMFASNKRLNELVDVKELMNRLIDAIEIDCKQSNDDAVEGLHAETIANNLNVLVYCVILFTHNVLNRGNDNNLFESLFVVFQQRAHTMKISLVRMLCHSSTEQNACVDKVLGVLFKMIYTLHGTKSQPQLNTAIVRHKTKRKSSASIVTASMHHHSYKLLKCTLESIVLYAAQETKVDKLRHILTFFQKYTICCCNIDLDIIYRILENALDKHMHKICLNFVKLNVLRTIFNDEIRCANCDVGRFIFEFKEKFIMMYKRWFQRLDTPSEVIIFFKHIAKISKYLHVDVQSHLLVDIVLPVFRREKQNVIDRMNHQTLNDDVVVVFVDDCTNKNTDKLLICCLLIFLCYLKDVTVIKAFFIEENIQHLEDLFVMPQFAYLISNVMKIGIDNNHFLGDNEDEQVTLNERLEALHINLFANAIEMLAILFNDIASVHRLRLRASAAYDDGELHENRIMKKFSANQLTTFDIVHLSVVYWSSILQIIRSTHIEFRARVEAAIARHQNVVFNFAFNSLSSVLFLVDPKHQRREDRMCREFKQKQLELTQRTLNVLSTSITSTTTSNDFECLFFESFTDAEIEMAETAWRPCLDGGCDRNSVLFDVGSEVTELKQSMTEHEYSSIKKKTFSIDRNEASLIFDLKNTSNELTSSMIVEHLKQGNSIKPNFNRVHLVMNIVQQLSTFVSRKVFGNVADSDEPNETMRRINEQKSEVLLFNGDRLDGINKMECKALLMQLFEITLGVLVCTYRTKKAGKNASLNHKN